MWNFSKPAVALLCAAATLSAVPPTPSTHASDPGTLTVHEWGTFTSIAGADGKAVEWLPQAGPTDLPCFVARSRFNVKGSLPGTVRMETPVLYFYSTRETTVNVKVRFRDGIVTEWFPPAAVTARTGQVLLRDWESVIAWRDVKVLPGGAEDFPVEQGSSHYYAARQTNAAPLRSGADREKFLFYRGVGRFAPSIRATVDEDGKVAVTFAGDQSSGDVILYERHRGRAAYQLLRGRITVDPPVAEQEPMLEIEKMLLDGGLFPQEASAMIATWRDSWFEEGTRLFYVVPRPVVDSILPLEISPAQTGIARVFVGRIELATPETLKEIRAALVANDTAALHAYGRFLQPLARRILAESAPSDRAMLGLRLKEASSAWIEPQDTCASFRELG